MKIEESHSGTVYLVGAGPGDPELLTVRAARLLARAGAVLYDALVNPKILDEAPPEADRIDVGRRAGVKRICQDDVNALLIELAGTHEVVVRLKGGDPFVFGRGGEEALALRAAGIPFEVVPGVTSGVGALAYAGIPLTHRNVSSSVTFVTGHQVSPAVGRGTAGNSDPHGLLPARDEGTLVIFMGLTRVEEIAHGLIRGGRSPETPAAVVESGTYPEQRTVAGVLADIASRTREAGFTGPALVVVGEVVALREGIRWYPERGELEGSIPVGAGGGAAAMVANGSLAAALLGS